MIDEDEVRNRLVAKQTELQRRITGTQATERSEIAERDIQCAREAEQGS